MKDRKNKEKKAPNSFLRFTSMATQMAIVIGLGVFGGIQLDAYFKNESPIYTLILSLFGVGLSMYLVIKDLTK